MSVRLFSIIYFISQVILDYTHLLHTHTKRIVNFRGIKNVEYFKVLTRFT